MSKKSALLADRLEAIVQVFNLGAPRPIDVATARERLATLTPREAEVLDGLVAGYNSAGLAAKLGISPKTIDIHRSKVTIKMNTRRVADVIRYRLLVLVANVLESPETK